MSNATNKELDSTKVQNLSDVIFLLTALFNDISPTDMANLETRHPGIGQYMKDKGSA